MRKIVINLVMTIDGFIARNNGSFDWLENDVELGEYGIEEFITRVDSIVVGRTSYEQTLTFGEWPFPEHKTNVLSSKDFTPKSPNTLVVSENHAEFVKSMKDEAGKDIWCFGGGKLNHFLLENDLIDEMMLYIQPVVLGDGIGLFGKQEADLKKFKPKIVKELGSGFVLQWYTRLL